MDKITVFQHFEDFESFVWKKSEIEKVFNKIELNIDNRVFSINGLEYIWKNLSRHDFSELNFELEIGINVILFYSMNANTVETNLNSFFDKLKKEDKNKKVYFIFLKNVENYWGWYLLPQKCLEKKLKPLNEIENLKVIWEYPEKTLSNFYFSPKLAVQTFYNNPIFKYGSLFFLGNELFKGISKSYRIGFHIGNLGDYVRNYLAVEFFNYDNKNIWITIADTPFNKRTIDNKKLINCVNFNSKYWNNINKFGDYMSDEWYLEQFIEMTIKSDIEIVYETHTPIFESDWAIKFTEKTLKLLYLGKPFIHTDAVAFNLLKKCGFKPCYSLYSEELINIYKDYKISKLNEDNKKYLPSLKNNIEWLANMDSDEWNRRLIEANEVAQYNYDRVRQLIFETSLIDMIKDIENGIQ
jgi:hypothetical protein